MSEAFDGEDREAVAFIRMWAEDTFDGQERVMTKAAYDLQCRATSHSAVCGHPGYVPDDCLEHLESLGIETTITAAELCAIGTWDASAAATASWTGKPSNMPVTGYASAEARTRRPWPKNGTTKPAPGPAWPRRS